MQWFANMIKDDKINALLYLRGAQSIGKSTTTQFIINHVIGSKLSLETGSESLISRFNIEIGGELLVLFEEFKTFLFQNGIQ